MPEPSVGYPRLLSPLTRLNLEGFVYLLYVKIYRLGGGAYLAQDVAPAQGLVALALLTRGLARRGMEQTMRDGSSGRKNVTQSP